LKAPFLFVDAHGRRSLMSRVSAARACRGWP